MTDFAINVRAVVRASKIQDDASGDIAGWDVYDFDEQDGTTTFRCDQLVRVQAENEAEAIEAAKADATTIVVEGYEIEGIELWVDEGIDVNPDFADTAVPGA